MKNSFLPILYSRPLRFQPGGQSQDKTLKEFDSYVEKSRMAWEVPGMAVVVVKTVK